MLLNFYLMISIDGFENYFCEYMFFVIIIVYYYIIVNVLFCLCCIIVICFNFLIIYIELFINFRKKYVYFL